MVASDASGRIAVRLEGGIGDHLLGMRILGFVRQRFPHREIVVYSDANGGEAQLAVARLSPDADRVVAVRLRAPPPTTEVMGRLENLDPDALAEIRGADLFLDTWGPGFFLATSCRLAVPVYEILAARPRLAVPPAARRDADLLLARWPEARFLVVNLNKHGPDWLDAALGLLHPMLEELLADPRVVVLAPVSTRFPFAHWPAAERASREDAAAAELDRVRALADWHERVAILPDLPIAVVAALLRRASYFIGVDNGIKHLAWALGVPRTVLMSKIPKALFALRWCPDLHRVLPLAAADTDMLASHLAEAKAALATESRSRVT
ncbi:MAG: glycosyltransferase family 9 protein [Alphaproteobacteria bacterium]